MNAGFSPEERCLIGVSGGRDSVALLHQLHAAGFRELIVCHLDHALRPESAAEVRFVIRDEGPGFDQSRLADPTDPENWERVGGRGLLLIRTFMDEVWHNPAGNEITLVKHAESKPAQAAVAV